MKKFMFWIGNNQNEIMITVVAKDEKSARDFIVSHLNAESVKLLSIATVKSKDILK